MGNVGINMHPINADTLDGFHANEFPRMMGDITDCDDAIEYGTYNVLPETLNSPAPGYYCHLVVEQLLGIPGLSKLQCYVT